MCFVNQDVFPLKFVIIFYKNKSIGQITINCAKQKQLVKNLFKMSKLKPNSVYELTRPARIDPKFVGIGEVYMEHKHKRQEIERIYHDTKNSLLYAEKTNLNLSKSLNEKQKQLKKLQNAKQRHNQDHANKMMQEERQRQKMQQMRIKASSQRRKLKSSIQQRMSSLRSQRRRDKNNLKMKSMELRQQLQTSQTNRFSMRKNMHDTIRSQKQKGAEKVDNFYRQRILHSLNEYNAKIKKQEQKTVFFQQSIEKMNQAISQINQINHKKQRRLIKLEEKIQTLNPLKSFFSTKLSNNLNQVSFSRKSSFKSISSKKPSEILLEDHFLTGANLGECSKQNLKKNQKVVNEQNPESFEFYQVEI